MRLRRTRIPDFDRLVTRAGHDLSPIVVEAHRADETTVGLGLLSQEIQGTYVGRQEASDLAKER